MTPVGARSARRAELRLATSRGNRADAIFPVSVLDVLMGLQGPANVTLARAPPTTGAPAPHWKRGGAERRQLRDLSGRSTAVPDRPRAATDADLVFLDEPTTALDATAEHEVLELTEQLRAKRGAAVVMVTHLVEDGLERADHALLLDRDHGVALPTTAAGVRALPEFERVYGRFVGRGEARP